MKRSFLSFLDLVAYGLSVLFVVDRLLKLVAVLLFFRRRSPPQPGSWPTVTLLQPITRGSDSLMYSLRKRAAMDYPVSIQHLFICDSHDTISQLTVYSFMNEFPLIQAELIPVYVPDTEIASKIKKLQAALPKATGEILCFMDDDVSPRQDTLRLLVPYLNQPRVGAAFGLPCYTNWHSSWSSLMSGLVNANMLLSFIALSYLAEPFRITGHIVVFYKNNFEKVGGLVGLEEHIDDDFELARRLRSHDLLSMQTPLIYDIDNALPSKKAYDTQIKRWFVLPRQAMMPSLSAWERFVAFISSCTLPIPGIIAIMAVLTNRRASLKSLAASLSIFTIVYAICDARFLKGHTPFYRWPLLLLGAVITPLQIVMALMSNNEIEWRGQRMRVKSNGKMEVMK